GKGFSDGNDAIRSQLVENSEDEFTFDGESCHGLAIDNRFAGLGIEDAGHDRRTVANGANNAAAVPDVRSDFLETFRRRVVVQSGVASRSEEEAIVTFPQIGRLLQLRLDLDHERMSGVVEDRVLTSRQERRRERDIVE